MNILDMIALGLENLRRTKLRTTLTALGVVIGIGALTSMVSFGTGMQRNITEALTESDLFTSLFVTPVPIDIEHLAEGGFEGAAESLAQEPVPLTDSTVTAIRGMPGVDIVFPEVEFPVRIRVAGHEARTRLQALPAAMGAHPPFDDLLYGEFFTDDSSAVAVVQWGTLERMGLVVEDGRDRSVGASADSLGKSSVVPPDSVIGRQVEVISAVIDIAGLAADPMRALMPQSRRPFGEAVTEFKIIGVLKKPHTFSESRFDGGVFVPLRAAERIPRLGFSSVWDLLNAGGGGGQYGSIYVRVGKPSQMQSVRDSIEAMGLSVFSISDQLKEIRRGFLIVDSVLGAVGTIALVVAALGIANTMVMSILERTREIGIMKAIGASDGEVRLIFFAEAATIGLVGACFGLVLGWLVTRAANLVVNAHLLPEGERAIDLFYFPVWLIAGAVGFSLVISLVAGLYPAARAARVDPVTALRHD